MKFLIVLTVALASAAGTGEADAPIVKSSFDSSPEGGFAYSYETGNQIVAQALGSLKSIPGENSAVVVNGDYKYVAPDGQVISVTYEADENGFRPQGSHLPVPPSIPEYIVRSLDYIAAHPPPSDKVPARAVTALLG